MAEWDKITGETDKAYRAFWDYCLMGSGRSLAKLAQKYSNEAVTNQQVRPPTTSLDTLTDWSGRWGWVSRVQAYDHHQLMLDREAWEREREENRKQRRNLLRASLGKLAQALNSLDPTDPNNKADYATIMNGIKIVTEQLRTEYGDAQKGSAIETTITSPGADGSTQTTRVVVELNDVDF